MGISIIIFVASSVHSDHLTEESKFHYLIKETTIFFQLFMKFFGWCPAYNTEDGIMRDDSEILPGQNFL